MALSLTAPARVPPRPPLRRGSPRPVCPQYLSAWSQWFCPGPSVQSNRVPQGCERNQTVAEAQCRAGSGCHGRTPETDRGISPLCPRPLPRPRSAGLDRACPSPAVGRLLPGEAQAPASTGRSSLLCGPRCQPRLVDANFYISDHLVDRRQSFLPVRDHYFFRSSDSPTPRFRG